MSIRSIARTLRSRSTDAEIRLWYLLRSRRFRLSKFRRQHPIGKFVVDFACIEHRIVIEVDGGQHQNQAQADRIRDEFLRSRGFRILRFWNNEVLSNARGVLEQIDTLIQSASTLTPGPSPARAGEGSDTT